MRRPIPGARRPAPHGFTLVEVMVVLAIVGLMGGAILLTLPDDATTLHRQADAFGLRLVRAREEAILGGRAVMVSADAERYAFARRRYGDWQPLREGPFAEQAWSDGVHPAFRQRQQRASFVFDPTGAAEPQTLTLVRGGHRVDVVLDSAGKVRIDAATR